ncbi:multiple sugar transport system permease protein [Pullulanibacillus pueri]|uniref:Sugar ABC transporter permease n=1 Tax=Pullulanibacillus pueri TaxID=1437324 RepID=A0A8J2ZSV5_9BACL|nr:sugar ABC transporter permease [Pullulanibacillus pueri]MBM7681847.1 multiple sugar transport system permease protein [Pullulanibacillus pueri]GGH76324.1 sugar ABC transporter permease [Pullulanibacillus pueri]
MGYELNKQIAPQVKQGRKKMITQQGVMGYIFMLPSLVFYFIFLLIPLVFSLFLSFTEWGGFDFSLIKWVGFKNYKDFFFGGHGFLYPVLTNTLIFAFGSVLVSFFIALVISYMITRLRLEGFWRTLYFLPMVTNVVAVGNVWDFMYDPTNGLINSFLNTLGLPTVKFMDNPHIALYSVIIVAVWSGIGSAILILSAGLKNIPDSYYEAATIDGAGSFRLFWNVTVPLLKPSILFVLITGFIGGLQSFNLILVMTGDGGPGNSTNVLGLEMYNQAFKYGQWGMASAMAFILFVIVLIITLIQLRVFRSGGVENY